MSQPISEIEQTINIGIEKLRGKTRMPMTVAELEDVPYGAYEEFLDDIAKGSVRVRKHKVGMVYMSNLFMTAFEKLLFLSILLWSWMLPVAGVALAIVKSWEFVFLAAACASWNDRSKKVLYEKDHGSHKAERIGVRVILGARGNFAQARGRQRSALRKSKI